MKKRFAAVWCAVLFLLATVPAVSAASEKVNGVRWFSCDAGAENDPVWEVQSGVDTYKPQNAVDDTALLSVSHNTNGAVTLTRTDADSAEVAAAAYRTIKYADAPALDLATVDTLYFDVEALFCSWNLYLTFGEHTVKLGHAISKATDADVGGGSDTSEDTAPAGGFVGKINLIDTLKSIAAEDTENAADAAAILGNTDTVVPQITLVYRGTTDGSLTIKSLFLSDAKDENGSNCVFMQMSLLDENYVDVTTTTVSKTTTQTTADVPYTADSSRTPVFAALAALSAVTVVILHKFKHCV